MKLVRTRAALVAAIAIAPPLAAQSATRTNYVDGWHAKVVHAAGLTPLAQTTLASGDREIRIWLGGGFVAPSWLYRFTSRNGRASGEIIFYWPAPSPPAISSDTVVRASLGSACAWSGHADDVSVCRASFTRRPRWSALVDSLDALGVWTIPNAPKRAENAVTTDGWAAIVELRDGSAFRAYSYDNPDAHSSVPSVARVAEIVRTVRTLDSLVVPSGSRREP